MDAQVGIEILGCGAGEGASQSVCEVFADLIPLSAEDREKLAAFAKLAQIPGRKVYIYPLEGRRGVVRIAALSNLSALTVGVIQK